MPFHKGCFLKDEELAGIAILNRSIVAPTKMGFVADLLRNKSVSLAFSLLSCKQRKCSVLFEKLLLSAVSNFEKECERRKEKFYNLEDIYISTICVGSAGMLKRTLPAPRGSGFVIRKRLSNLVIVVKPRLLKSKGKNKGMDGHVFKDISDNNLVSTDKKIVNEIKYKKDGAES